MALSFYPINSKIILESLGKLNNLGRNNNVTLQWVPDRDEVQENVEAATVARKGTPISLTEPYNFYSIGDHAYYELPPREKLNRR